MSAFSGYRQEPKLKAGYLVLVIVSLFMMGILNWNGENRIDTVAHPKYKPNTPKPLPDIGLDPDEWARMLNAVAWPLPDRPISNASKSTSPTHTRFTFLGLKNSYQVGEELHVTWVAKNFEDNPKRHGGDFFQAKLFSSQLQASVFGDMCDLLNGTYRARFLLPWVGEAQVAVRLIHSSEAVQVLKRHRDYDSDRVFFWGYYTGSGPNGTRLSERVECNVKWNGAGLQNLAGRNCCEYKNPRNEEIWVCQKPLTLPCNTLVDHSMGGYRNRLTTFETTLMHNTLINKYIEGDNRPITVKPSNSSIGKKEKCVPGMLTPTPSGFYLKNVWTSLVCAGQHFNTSTMVPCLKDRNIYIMGDSTIKQWFEYFLHTLPTLKGLQLHSSYQIGPLLAVDVENNIVMHWRSHGLPLRSLRGPFRDLHYISDEIDDLAGGPRTVIAFNMWAHFTTYPLAFFARRVAHVRKAVVALLRRAPETTVIIKSANTGYKDVFGSDWFSLQLDRLLREAFRGVSVVFLDVWQMTACHSNPETIHPGPDVIKNEVDLLLSFICPNQRA